MLFLGSCHLFLVLAILLSSVTCVAAPQMGAEDGTPMQPFIGSPESDREPGIGIAPPFSNQLIEANLEIPGYAYQVMVDIESLEVVNGKGVRYGVLLRSAAGSETRAYEELNCLSRKYRSVAYGKPDGSWERAADQGWHPVRDAGGYRYRYAFYRGIMCNEAIGPWGHREILRRLHSGKDGSDDE